ncbi:hypothetical protein F4778DRAFT_743663 [Xylariomycetidae sp. FL2044]|nr:hypothetical protein F4778DRAFT_743663 [Xylariomycetidae sp. FL2044]
MKIDVPPGTPDRGPGIVILCILLIVLVSIAAIGRITAKLVVKQYWWWDDFFALLSFPIQITLLAIVIAWRDIGLGLHAEAIAAQNPMFLLQGAKQLYVAIFFFDGSISFPKLSAIFFYARVFRSNNRAFRMHLWIVGSIVVGWIVSAIISTIFQCTPIEKAWNSTLPGQCINSFAWYLATATISVLVDFYILLLPLPMIWALNVSVKRRVYLLVTFFLAYSVIVLSIGRLVSTVQLIPTVTEDLTWLFPLYLYWACLEGSISFISISMPNMIGLFNVLMASGRLGFHRQGSGSSGQRAQKLATSGTPAPPAHGSSLPRAVDDYERLVGGDGSFVYDADVHGPEHAGPLGANTRSIPLDRIRVDTQIHVSTGEDVLAPGDRW